MNFPLTSAAPLTVLEVRDQLGYARSVFETVREPLLLLDGDARVHMANAAFLRTFGLSAEAAVGQTVSSLDGGRWNLPALIEKLTELQQSSVSFEDLEIVQNVDGASPRVLLMTGRLLDAPHNGDRMTLLAIVDVTERQRVAKALAWHAVEVERSNRDLQGYAFVASHDLQEPLRKIRAYGDLLLTECGPQLDGVGRDYATRMVSASARMQTLVSDLLRLAVVGTGLQSFGRFNLGDVVREVLIDMELAIRESGALVHMTAMPTIACDRPQMRQLFQNLISNALKFHRGIPPVINIDMVSAETPAFVGAADGSPWVSVRVRDNGIGFETRHGDTIFAPFERLHGRGKYPGSGIGLTLCRRICERHSGFIACESIPSVGTLFTVTLPSRRPLEL